MKTITKEQRREFKSIAVASERLKNRIEALYHYTDNMNYLLNYQAIQYHANKLSELLEHDFDASM